MLINGRNYKLKYTGLSLLIYKEEFGSDLLEDCNNLLGKNLDIVAVLKVCWAMAKSGDDSVPDFREFMSMIDVNETLKGGILEEMIATVSKDGKPSKELKKK